MYFYHSFYGRKQIIYDDENCFSKQLIESFENRVEIFQHSK